MARAEPLTKIVIDVLTSGPARRIDFWLGAIHVDGAGLGAVAELVQIAANGGKGVAVIVNPLLRPDAAASYSNGSNAIKFPRANYGTSALDRICILHESVHAMHDVLSGGRIISNRGSRLSTRTESEAAAYIAGALFGLDDSGTSIDEPVYAEADAIARKIRGKAGARVAPQDELHLRQVIAADPAYRDHGVTLTAPTRANGL